MSNQKVDLNINVKHITRVEGHGNIVVNVKNGSLEKCELNIVEAPRFFESFLKGRNWQEAAFVTSRICGICAPGHQLTSLKATEDAMNIKISEQTLLLRKLLCDASLLQSHILHVYFLVAPDLLGVPSVIPLVDTHPDIVKRALRLKKLANDICDVVAGRAVHPITMIPGGVTKVPLASDLLTLKERIQGAIPDVMSTVETISSLVDGFPDFSRETEYISLKNDSEYALYDGDIYSSDTGSTSDKNYRSMTNEKVVTHSSGKHARANRESFMVGALARCNNNWEDFNDTAKAAAEALGFAAPCWNPFFNNVCQVIEVGLVAERMMQLIDRLCENGLKEEAKNTVKIRAGKGIGATELPRGILYHEYTYDKNGVITDANCIIPTGQNLANIEEDMKALVPQLLGAGKDQAEITLAMEMLVRAYDPCISCAVHLLNVTFVE